MVFIGKITGGLAGYWLGGIYGSLAGTTLGHALDYFLLSGNHRHKEIDYAVKVIALGAKMAKADGVVTPDEVEAFKDYFQIPEEEVGRVARVFNMAKKDIVGYEEYARQLVRLVDNDRQVLESVLDGLFHIANADLVLHPEEERFLRAVAGIFGFSDDDYAYVLAYHSQTLADNPFALLNSTPDMSDSEIARNHRKLVRDNHPDSLRGKGLPEQLIREREKKLAQINAAFDTVKKTRGADKNKPLNP